MVKAERFSLYQLKPAKEKQRLAVVVSPDELNEVLDTVIVAPLLSSQGRLPFRVPILFKGKNGEIAADRITAVSKTELVQKIGILPEALVDQISTVLGEMFS